MPRVNSKYFAEPRRSTRSSSKADASAAVKAEPQDLETTDDAKETSPSTASKAKAVQKRKNEHIKVEYEDADKKDVKQEKWEPPSWLTVIENIKKMRSGGDAPVDDMGCHKCHDENEVSLQTQRFQKLVALMLSSQTKDQVTHAAMQRMVKVGLSTKNILAMPVEELEELIKPVSFYKRKAVYLKGAAKVCEEEYGGDIPSTVDDLCKLVGVGPKMAHLCMQTAWNKCTGIAVDTHVHRISHRLGWVRKPQSDPKKTQIELEAWIPQEYWETINHMLVGFGQTICTPLHPKCGECLNNRLCPVGRKTIK